MTNCYSPNWGSEQTRVEKELHFLFLTPLHHCGMNAGGGLYLRTQMCSNSSWFFPVQFRRSVTSVLARREGVTVFHRLHSLSPSLASHVTLPVCSALLCAAHLPPSPKSPNPSLLSVSSLITALQQPILLSPFPVSNASFLHSSDVTESLAALGPARHRNVGIEKAAERNPPISKIQSFHPKSASSCH